jgi:hypothetical protein
MLKCQGPVLAVLGQAATMYWRQVFCFFDDDRMLA